MAYLATARAAHRLGLASGIRREVVLMHVALGVLIAQAVQYLHVAHSAQRDHCKHLGLTARKHRAAMRAGQQAGLAPYRAHLGQRAAVGTYAGIEYLAAHYLLLERIERVVYLALAALELGVEVLMRLGGHDGLAVLALVAVERVERPVHAVIREVVHRGLDVVAHDLKRELALGLAYLRDYLLLERDELLYLLVRQQYALEHDLLGHLVGARLDHHDGVLGTGHGQVQVGRSALLIIGIYHEFAVYQTDIDRTGRTGEGYIAYAQRYRRAYHRRYLRRLIGVHRQHRRDHLHVVAHALGEQRTYRTVDQAGGQYRLFGGPALALYEAAGYLADRDSFSSNSTLSGKKSMPARG